MENQTALAGEWTTLQNNYERYEHGALLIKLAAVILFSGGVAMGLEAWFGCVLVAILWLQEGIFKTYQARLGERLLHIESLLASPAAADDGPPHRAACQLHSVWLLQRPGVSGLLREYAASAGRPTVAFPYVVLLFLGLVLSFL